MFRVSIVLTVALAVLAVAPAAQARVPEGFFGAMWDREATRAPEAAQDQQWALMAASGVRTVRTVFWWSKAEFSAGQPYDFSETDAVSPAPPHDIELLPPGVNTPEWPGWPANTARRPARERLHLLPARARASSGLGIVLGPAPRLPRLPLATGRSELALWTLGSRRPTPDAWAPVARCEASERTMKQDPGHDRARRLSDSPGPLDRLNSRGFPPSRGRPTSSRRPQAAEEALIARAALHVAASPSSRWVTKPLPAARIRSQSESAVATRWYTRPVMSGRFVARTAFALLAPRLRSRAQYFPGA